MRWDRRSCIFVCVYACVSVVSKELEQAHYEEFFEDVFIECESQVRTAIVGREREREREGVYDSVHGCFIHSMAALRR